MSHPEMLEADATTASEFAPELSIVMPCLNEARTVGTCVQKALAYLEMYNVPGEVIVADNGSNDGSQAIAAGLGARVVPVSSKGYGNALRAGIKEARGRFVIMGDSDDSYDFLTLQPFLEKLRDGYDLVLGNRFRGGIAPGAMPPLHRFFGNPFLTLIGRTLYRSPSRDVPEPQPGFLLWATPLSSRRGAVARTRCGGDGIRPRKDREGEHSPSSDHRGADPLVGRRPWAALAPAQPARRVAQPSVFPAAQPARRVSLSGRRGFSVRPGGHADPVWRRYCRGTDRLCRAYHGHDRRSDQYRLRIDAVLGLCQGDRDSTRAASAGPAVRETATGNAARARPRARGIYAAARPDHLWGRADRLGQCRLRSPGQRQRDTLRYRKQYDTGAWSPDPLRLVLSTPSRLPCHV